MLDSFDPCGWPAHDGSAVCYLHLSNRFDVYALVDEVDYEWAREHKWCHTYGAGPMVEVADGIFAMARPNHIYARRCVGGRTLWLHREILTRWQGAPRSNQAMVGDHLNGLTLDCRRSNLRWATRSENSANRTGSDIRKRFLARGA